ncbi:Cu(I)-responsive transcriptional regulator [Vibrio sp. Isolate31]|uniref:Cu(I)-responsive transcriptional regulator n=1 Tax=unclassified Vibrio TaxID=2614977 RepID=UPI001EFEBA4B|nr:Cu(I)-responsive transcriptional regulator [Vibrio sp. Isolate32]MCG9602416.1 Cu(I)-responsive transcriptional regulator [Vibrio sp. Isolate31]
MNIGEVAKRVGTTAKSIRFYESKGMMSPPHRSENGYRQYGEIHIEQLEFVLRAKMVGFTLDECRALVELADNPCRESADVKAKALSKLEEVNQKIEDLLAIQKTLKEWVEQCPGDSNSHCPIIDSLVDKKP